jgi:hypothetical protein
MRAPANTIIPKIPGITLFLKIFAPKAAEKAGEVPLPPILIAKKMPIKKGIRRWLNKGEIMLE